MIRDLLATTVSVALGGFITWYVARRYYRKAAVELKEEAAQLRKLSQFILYMLKNPGADIDFERDEHGNVTGLIASAVARASGSGSAEGKSA